MPLHTNDLDRKLIHSKPWARAGEETIFKKWISIKRLTYEEVADLCGVSERSVAFWAHGQALPGLLPALKIEEISEGKVPAVCWLNTLLGRTLWKALNRQGLNEKEQAEAPRYRSHASVPKKPLPPPHGKQGPMHPAKVRRSKARSKAAPSAPVSQGKAEEAEEAA